MTESYVFINKCLDRNFNSKKRLLNALLPYFKSIYYVSFNLSGKKYILPFSENPYFGDSDITIYDNTTENTNALRMISFMLDKSVLKVIKSYTHYPKFVKWVFEHFHDVIYWTNKYNIVEVFEFIENLLKLRIPDNVMKKQEDASQSPRNSVYFEILNAFPECDLSLLFQPNQYVYSHFLWTYTDIIQHKYNLAFQELPSNKFCNDMLNAGKLLPPQLEKMLIANLYILMQNS